MRGSADEGRVRWNGEYWALFAAFLEIRNADLMPGYLLRASNTLAI